MNLVADLMSALETVLDPGAVEKLKRDLEVNADLLDRGSFRDLRVTESVFGGSEPGRDLGFHHARAHDVVADTITGVIEDIRGFREGVVRAEQLLEAADTGTAADLGRATAAVHALTDVTDHFVGDAHNRAARNEHLGGDR
ncbi:hypothetical protein ACFP3Q_06445 [Nocardioides sp. GCM10027113]|uniref:hypothetical protein n=1 Tax=unclassified Nocardioides TaxID=2615069 RepID=UPI00361AF210